MSDELQSNESVDNQATTENQPIEQTADSGSDLATGTGEDQDKKINDDKVQEAINKQHKKFRDEERRANAADERVKQLEQQLQANQPTGEPQVPPMPDENDFDFVDKVKAREKLIEERAEYRANVKLQQETAQQQQQAQFEQQQKDFEVKADNYASNAKTIGLDSAGLQQDAAVVADYKLDTDVINLLLEDKDGPLMVKYLAKNVIELDNLRSMNPIQAALHVEREVRAKAEALRPKTSSAPDPAKDVQSTGHIDEMKKKYPLTGGKVKIK